MNYHGVLRKMQAEWANPINYFLIFEKDFIHLNQFLDRRIKIRFVRYQCLACGQNKKIYRQGFCYEDFYAQAQAGDWILRPELSTAHRDLEDRDLTYEKQVQLQPHIVYLANSSNVKVGVTRKTQIPTRWIDQGAHSAIALIEVPNRYLAGITEVALKAYLSDKTAWRKMLRNEVEKVDLKALREQVAAYIPEEVLEYYDPMNVPVPCPDCNGQLNQDAAWALEYPVHRHPGKPKTLNLEKTPEYEGILKGVKGQYLIFEDDTVFNVRNSEGYVVELSMQPHTVMN